MKMIVDTLEKKFPGYEVICVHTTPSMIEINSEMEKQLAKAIEESEEVDIRTVFS